MNHDQRSVTFLNIVAETPIKISFIDRFNYSKYEKLSMIRTECSCINSKKKVSFIDRNSAIQSMKSDKVYVTLLSIEPQIPKKKKKKLALPLLESLQCCCESCNMNFVYCNKSLSLL